MFFITREEEVQIDLPLQSVYFYASWMPYHNKYIIMLDKMKEKYQILSYAIDIDQFANQCKRFMIDSIPTVVILQKGHEIKRISGLVSTIVFETTFADICKDCKGCSTS